MKLVVYSIMKNEAANLQKWVDTLIKEFKWGDTITLLDTGSIDETVSIARKLAEQHPGRIHLHETLIRPWRFDLARQAALVLADVTADAAWALDLDEFPEPGWRDVLEASWKDDLSRLRYRYIWNVTKDGGEGTVFYDDKLHARHGFRWKGLAHEWLVAEEQENHVFTSDLQVIHRQDTSINRVDRDMELMERAIRELPDDERLQHYYARQLFFKGRMQEASEAFQRHLENPRTRWRHERAESMIYLARLGGNEAWNHQWLYRAIAECPERREVWVAAAQFEASRGNFLQARSLLGQAVHRPVEEMYLSWPEARDEGISRSLLRILEMEAQAEAEAREGSSDEKAEASEPAPAVP